LWWALEAQVVQHRPLVRLQDTVLMENTVLLLGKWVMAVAVAHTILTLQVNQVPVVAGVVELVAVCKWADRDYLDRDTQVDPAPVTEQVRYQVLVAVAEGQVVRAVTELQPALLVTVVLV